METTAVAPPPPVKEIKASDVVAAGAEPRLLQLPSPVYIAEWISPTHVILGAGGGGSRFGMLNVLVLLRVQTDLSRGSAPGPSPAAIANGSGAAGARKAGGPTVKLTAAQQAAVNSSQSRSSSHSSAAGQKLWHFVAALDLGGDVPWCASSYMHYGAAGDADALAGGAAREKGSKTEGSVGRFLFSAAQRETLRDTIGLLAVSSIKTFTLVAVERVAAVAKDDDGDGEGPRLRLRRLARVVVPNDPFNPDKKPLALVHNALVIAHDGKGVLLYDLADLVPERNAGKGDARPVEVEKAGPLAEWPLPARVNDLHANRVNLVEAKASCGEVKAMLFDFLLIAAAVQDKSVRLASFRLRRDYGPPPVVAEAETDANAEPTSGGGSIADTVHAPLRFMDGDVFTAEALGLAFRPLASSFRLVRLFGLEDLSAWPGATESARRRVINHSLSAVTAATNPIANSSANAPAPATTEVAPLPTASLLVCAYDADGNRTFLVARTLNTSLVFVDVVPWRPPSSTSPVLTSLVGAPQGTHHRPRKRLQPALRCSSVPCAGPSAVVGDCITCLAATTELPPAAACAEAVGRNPFGAAVPLHWVAGTIDGGLVRVVGHTLTPAHAGRPPPPPGKPSRTATSLPALPAGQIAFAGVQTRPGGGSSRQRRALPALHKEPVTAVAVSTENDVLSTDLAQNAAISTLPFTLIAATVGPATGEGGLSQVLQPAVTRQKVNGLELFPATHQDGVGGLAAVQFVGLTIVLGSLFILVVFLLLM